MACEVKPPRALEIATATRLRPRLLPPLQTALIAQIAPCERCSLVGTPGGRNDPRQRAAAASTLRGRADTVGLVAMNPRKRPKGRPYGSGPGGNPDANRVALAVFLILAAVVAVIFLMAVFG